MEETSSFETSEMTANFLASTPLLTESWRLCQLANASHGAVGGEGEKVGFAAEIGGTTTSRRVGYVAFSAAGIAPPPGEPGGWGKLVGLEAAGCCWAKSLFSDRRSGEEGEEGGGGGELEPVMVCGELLRIFWSVYQDTRFQSQISEVMRECNSVVVTGHSIGGTIASLCAIWLLSCLESTSPRPSVLCITFGSPLLGNESLSRAILAQRWAGNFCHVVSRHDIVPRLLFVPDLAPVTHQLHSLLHFCHLSLSAPQLGTSPLGLLQQLTDEAKTKLFHHVMASLHALLEFGGEGRKANKGSSFSPFGNYFFCSQDGGAICVDNAASVVRMMYLLLGMGSPSCSIDSHLNYGVVVEKVCSQFLTNRSFLQSELPESSYDAGLALALQSSGIDSQEPIARPAKDCLKIAKRLGRKPSLNCANLAIKLSQVTPYRAEIEWYKESCDRCDDQMGYYDSFKHRGASRRDAKVNMNRHKLARFWDNVITMLETNHLPHDFHKRAKWVNASQFYKLLVEPLDIAEYYRIGMQRIKGHYITCGREKRYQIFDRWWKEGIDRQEESNTMMMVMRSKFASLTQDTLFWARVEEAREWLESVRTERDPGKAAELWEKLDGFERYARGLVEKKEISKDVVAKNSSYSLWVKDYQEVKSQVETLLRPQFPNLMDAEVVP
ncbi:unnamed protein product [Linum trigynum]|uniref:Lipase-like PAD4 n=1 Tax=Linum trigynum TaxID=586398 RepID=A0AAV2DD77_9ROSI